MEVSSSDRLLTVKEAAEYLKVHWQTVRSYIKIGKLKSLKIGRNVRIRESELARFIGSKGKRKKKVEIEIRFIIKDRKKIEQRLIHIDAKITYHGHVVDHWFIPKRIKNMKQKDKYYDTGRGFGLRIRQQDNGYTGKISSSMEVKRLLIPYKHDTCLEHEIDISCYEEGRRLLDMMGFKEFLLIDKDRVVYKLGDYKVIIDTIKDFRTGVEIEIIIGEKREKVIPKLKEIAMKLGLNIEKEMTSKSLTYQAMKKLAKF